MTEGDTSPRHCEGHSVPAWPEAISREIASPSAVRRPPRDDETLQGSRSVGTGRPSAVLAHYRNEAGAARVQALIEEEGSEILIATPTLVEFRRRMKELGATSRVIDDAISAYEEMADGIVPIDKEAAEAAWQLSRSSGRRLPLVDSLIAGAARAGSAVLVHRDPHMGAIPANLLAQVQLGSKS